jgi:hypothetical protein
VAAFDIPVACHASGLHEFEHGPDVEGFGFGDELAPGILALEVDAICPDDTAFHLDVGDGALAFADAIIRYGELGFVPDDYMDGPQAVKQGVREAAYRLLDHRFDALLVAHGEPLVGAEGKPCGRLRTASSATDGGRGPRPPEPRPFLGVGDPTR